MNKLTLLAAATIAVGAAAPAARCRSSGASTCSYTKAPAIVQAAYDWSGFYVGINGGGATSNIDWNADGFGDEGSHHATGGTVGGQVGYRWQMSSWVFGLEAQGNWADFKGSNVSQIFAQHDQPDQDRLLRPVHRPDRLRLGSRIGLREGRRRGHRQQVHLDYDGVGGGLLIRANETRWGAARRRRHRIRLRSRAGRSASSTITCSWATTTSSPMPGFIADHIKEDVDLFTARVNYKFGGPVVARY